MPAFLLSEVLPASAATAAGAAACETTVIIVASIVSAGCVLALGELNLFYDHADTVYHLPIFVGVIIILNSSAENDLNSFV